MRRVKRRRYDEKLDGMPRIHHWKILRYVDPLWCSGVLVKINRNWEALVNRFLRSHDITATEPRTRFKLRFIHIRGGDFIAVARETRFECFYIYAKHVRILGLGAEIRNAGAHTNVYHRGYSSPILLKITGDTVVSAR